MSDQAGGFDDCQVELGRYQFLEDKEERKKRVRHLVVDCHDQSQQKQGNHSGSLSNPHPATHMTGLDLAASSYSPICAEGYTAAMGDDHEPEVLQQRLPDGSDDDGVRAAVETDYESSSASSNSSDIQSFTLLRILLAISSLLSKEEVKKIKFLAKSKISNDRLAQISKGYELFQALEKDGKFPVSYITKLLVEVKRDDLAAKLKAVPLKEAEEGQASTSRHSLSARRRHELSGEDASFSDSQSSDSDTLLDTHDRGRHLRKQTSLGSSRNHEQLQSSDEEYALSTSDDSRVSSRTSSPDNGSEISSDTPSLHNSVEGAQLLTSSACVSSQPPGSWECHGARPKQIQRSLVPAVGGEPLLPVIYGDGIDPSFLARHSQDNTGCDSPYQSCDSEIPVLNGSPSNGPLVNDSESSDDQQMLTLKHCVATSHILIERVLQEREREEQLRREQRVTRERRHNEEERENQEAERRPQQETVIASPQHCRLWFSCCMQFYPCFYCHSNVCDKSGHAAHFKCSCYQHEQQNGEGNGKTPTHNCVMCNRCLDPQEETHLCEPDECCECSGLLDAFSGCQILPCAHKIHEDCAIAMIQNGIHTCPICQRPIFDSPG